MTKIYTSIFFLILFSILSFIPLSAQVGINTDNPHPSSILEISATDKGMLTPRLTTAQREAISSPADGLMVYDSDLQDFAYYSQKSAKWAKVLNSNSPSGYGRIRYKIIKEGDNLDTVLAEELLAGGGTEYKLSPANYYEINGTVVFSRPINLNGANLSGLNSSDDKIIYAIPTAGALFTGTKGGNIKLLTIAISPYKADGTANPLFKVGKLFNIDATTTAATDPGKNLIYRDGFVSGFGTQGTLKGFGMIFQTVVLNQNCANGITYEDNLKVFLSNVAWFDSNGGTYEKVVGTTDIFLKQGGFSEVKGTAVAFDVSTNPIIRDGIMEGIVFKRTDGLLTSKFVNPYNAANFYTGSTTLKPTLWTGYNFDYNWSVNCVGIPKESDNDAYSEMTSDLDINTGGITGFSQAEQNSVIKKMEDTQTTSANLFRFSTGGESNRLLYQGKSKKFVNVRGNLSFRVSAKGITFVVYVAKNGVVINRYKVYCLAGSWDDIISVPLNASTEVSNGDYLEIFVQRTSPVNNGQIDKIKVVAMSLVAK